LAGAATSIIFAATKHVFRRDKSMFVATKLRLSGQNFCCDKYFVVTKMILAYIVWRQKVFVATKMILVAAPANHKHRADKCHDDQQVLH